MCRSHDKRGGPLSRLHYSDLSLLLIFCSIETVNYDYKAVTYDTVSPTQCIKDLYIPLLVSDRHFYSNPALINVYINKYTYLSTKILILSYLPVYSKNAKVINSCHPISCHLKSEKSCHLYCILMIQLPSFIE